MTLLRGILITRTHATEYSFSHVANCRGVLIRELEVQLKLITLRGDDTLQSMDFVSMFYLGAYIRAKYFVCVFQFILGVINILQGWKFPRHL